MEWLSYCKGLVWIGTHGQCQAAWPTSTSSSALPQASRTVLQCSNLTSRSLIVFVVVALPLLLQAAPGQPPDVWLQLLERCAADSECQPAITCNLAQQLAVQEALNRQQQQDLTDLRQDATNLRQQLAEQQQLNAALQEQVAGHGAQLQALEAKLQQLLRL